MQKVVAELGSNLFYMLFLHAVLGVVSPPSLKKFDKHGFRDQANLFDVPVSVEAEIKRAGENALVMLKKRKP